MLALTREKALILMFFSLGVILFILSIYLGLGKDQQLTAWIIWVLGVISFIKAFTTWKSDKTRKEDSSQQS